MKQSFLDSLTGLPQKEAKKLVEDQGYKCKSIANGNALIALAFPNTVILWLDSSKKVKEASAGDPVEIEE